MDLQTLNEKYDSDIAFDALKRHAFFVPGMGPSEPGVDLMLVGEAPGSLENAKQLPFQGLAGQKMSNLLHKADIELDPDNIYVTNVVKFWPQKPAGTTRKPTDRELQASKPYLEQEIEIVQPKLVGLMGFCAITTMFPSVPDVYSVNGKLLEDKFVPLYHPIAAQYNPLKAKQVQEGYTALGGYLKELKDGPKDAA